MKKIMMFCLCMYGCADYTIHKGKGYDEDFKPYVVEYVTQAAQHNKAINNGRLLDLTIKLNDLSKIPPTTTGNTVVGLCEIKEFEVIVSVEKQWWPWANEYDRMSVMLHELGHCLSRFKHRDKDSIMNATAINGHRLDAKYKYYVNELFE
jgi:hypothetical protein